MQVQLDERRKNKAESDKEADEEDVREEDWSHGTTKAWLNMGTRNLVAKNDLYYVHAAGNDWQLADARKNRAGWHEGPWHCMVFVTE